MSPLLSLLQVVDVVVVVVVVVGDVRALRGTTTAHLNPMPLVFYLERGDLSSVSVSSQSGERINFAHTTLEIVSGG